MSMSDKLIAIINKMERVYNAGVFDAGFEVGKEHYTEVGREEGRAEYAAMVDEMWANIHAASTIRTDYSYAFAGWKDEFFKPQETLVPIGEGAYRMFFGANILSIDVPRVDFSQATGLVDTFRGSGCKSITVNAQNVTKTYRAFNSAIDLERLVILNLSRDCTFDKNFTKCEALVDLQIYGTIGQNGFDVSRSPLLPAKTIVDHILNNLADYSEDTSGTQWVCTLGEGNLEKLSDTDIAIATGKGWTLA